MSWLPPERLRAHLIDEVGLNSYLREDTALHPSSRGRSPGYPSPPVDARRAPETLPARPPSKGHAGVSRTRRGAGAPGSSRDG